MSNLKIFGLGPSLTYADKVCETLGILRSQHSEECHDDGEPYLKSNENVRGEDVFVISSLYNCSNERLADKVIKLLFFAGSLRDASAARITLVLPYLAYQRQDRKTSSRAPVYTKYFPEMVESILRENDRILTMDVHNLSAFQSGFRMSIDHLEAKTIASKWLATNLRQWEGIDLDNLCAGSPDEGGVKRTGFYRSKLQDLLGVEVDNCAIYKTRIKNEVNSHGVMGDVKDKSVILFDDMLSSGSTLVKGTQAIEKEGGKVIAAVATHGLFVGSANENVDILRNKGIKIVVTDSINPYALNEKNRAYITTIPTYRLFAEAIRCIHNEESVSRLIV